MTSGSIVAGKAHREEKVTDYYYYQAAQVSSPPPSPTPCPIYLVMHDAILVGAIRELRKKADRWTGDEKGEKVTAYISNTTVKMTTTTDLSRRDRISGVWISSWPRLCQLPG